MMPVVMDDGRVLMSMEDEVPVPRARPLPTSPTQLVGHGVGVVAEGLTARSPWMLGIVVLNVIGIASAVYFLNLLISGQQQHLSNLVETQNRQQTEILQMHKQEFDALLARVPQQEVQAPVATAPPAPPPVQQGRRP